jgi:hypothetical protein
MINIIPTNHFKRQFKTLVKKYRSLKSEIAILGVPLMENPNQGVALARGAFKIRLAIASKNKGKSGGFFCNCTKMYEKSVPLRVFFQGEAFLS